MRYNITSGLLHNVLETLSPPILEGSEKDIVLEDLVYIGSYNWVDSVKPTIVVPGSPRIWAEKEMPMNVPVDSGRNFIDQNAHRMSKLTLLPLIRAVQDMTDQGVTQQFDWPSVDFVADRGYFRRLLHWAMGSSDEWRADTQLAGANTVLLSGCPPVSRERSGRSNSYGFNYEAASTYAAPGLENQPSHYRIIAYNFDGLRLVVRCEVDACLPYDAAPLASTSNNPATVKGDSGWKLASGSSLKPLGLKIIRAGSSEVPQTHLLELKTHTMKDDGRMYMDWPKTYPQLFLSQTPHVHHAYHKNGTFTIVKKFTLGESDLVDVDNKAQIGFKKLRKVLGCIKSLVLKHGATMVSLVCTGGALRVYQIPRGESCLPKDALALFAA